MRRALIIGIDKYQYASDLRGCVKDATAIKKLMERNGDSNASKNYDCKLVTSNEISVSKDHLNEVTKEFFEREAESGFLYFSGHGLLTNLSGYLISQDGKSGRLGLDFRDMLDWANKSKIKQIDIVLDCCHAGAFGSRSPQNGTIELREGISILTASRAREKALENDQGGHFSQILVNGLRGEAADIRGEIKISSLYAMADSLLSSWSQRPMLKTHLSKMAPLRKVEPRVSNFILRNITKYFPEVDFKYPLSPRDEPTLRPADLEREAVFGHLQQFRALGMVEPVGTPHMYYAAKESKYCKLTGKGRLYWRLVKEDRI